MARIKKRFRWLVLVCVSAALLWQRARRRRSRRSEWARPPVMPAPSRETGTSTEEARNAPSPATAGASAAEAPAAEAPAAAATVDDGVPGAEEVELDLAEAARILGCSSEEVSALLDGGPTTRESVEEIALQHYRWRRHVDDPDSYWVTLKQASTILGVPPERVKQMLESGDVPYVVHKDGVRLMRREQLAK